MYRKKFTVYDVVFIGTMAAAVFVVTLFRVPVGSSKLHFANAFCLLAGLLFGPVSGGLSAGIGSGLYDLILGGYDIPQTLITFVSKFLMAFVCGLIFSVFREKEKCRQRLWLFIILSCIAGALTYVALYMVKSFVYQRFVYGFPMDAVMITLTAKLIPSLINALAAVVVTPILYPPLKKVLSSAMKGKSRI